MTGWPQIPSNGRDHIRNKQRREEIAKRFKIPNDPFKVVIVRDMWLTGFDAPCLHTMYMIKPMHGHGLMQAIARVNRVFKDKPGGLIVDYIGLAPYLNSLWPPIPIAAAPGRQPLPGRGSGGDDGKVRGLL